MSALELQTTGVLYAEVGALHADAAGGENSGGKLASAPVAHVHVEPRVPCPWRPDQKVPDLKGIRGMRLVYHREKKSLLQRVPILLVAARSKKESGSLRICS